MRAAVTIAMLALCLMAAERAYADPANNRANAEATALMFGTLIIGDYDHLKIRCHRWAPHPRTWKCLARWSSVTDAYTVTRCKNPNYWIRPVWVEMDESRTRCRAITAATRG